MAAHQTPRPNNQERAHEPAVASTAASAAVASAAPLSRKPAPLQDPEDMVLLREKLNLIAVGRRYSGASDNQLDHMDEVADVDDEYESCHSGDRQHRSRSRAQSGHFRVFVGDRPSTPPSSPQPRDLLRKQLRMKNHHQQHHHHAISPHQRSHCSEDNNSDTASDEPLDGMCVDGIEISPLPESDDTAHHHQRVSSPPSVRLSVPDHLRTRSSSYNMLNKCPEGFRKRKSTHIDDKLLELDGDTVLAPLKRVSSQASVAAAAWDDYSKTTQDQEMEDASLDPSTSPPTGASPCS